MIESLLVLLVAFVAVAAFIAATFGLAYWYRRTFGVQLWVRFLERSGFRRADNPHAPLADQARAILGEMGHPTGAVRGPWVRTVGSWNVRYRSWMHLEGDKPVTEQVWLLQLAHPIGFQMQLLERSRAVPGFVPTLASTALGRDRRWGEQLRDAPAMGRIPFVDSTDAFDERFVVRTDSPADARSFLASAAVRAALMALPEALVVVADEWITIDDPTGVIHRKSVGLSAITPAQILERELPMHALMIDTLSTLARPLSLLPAPVASAPAIVKHALPGPSPASLSGRVESFRGEQGFGVIRLEDGRDVAFDISHSTAPLREGDSVHVQATAREGRLVAACVWTDQAPVPIAPSPRQETRYPTERVLQDLQRAGLLTGVTLHQLAVVMKQVGSVLPESIGESELEDVLVEYYASEPKSTSQRDAVQRLPLYEAWSEDSTHRGRDAWLSFCARELEAFTGVTSAAETLLSWGRENLDDEPESTCPQELMEGIEASFGAALDPRWRPGLFALCTDPVLLLLRDPRSFVELQNAFAEQGTLDLLVTAERLSPEGGQMVNDSPMR